MRTIYRVESGKVVASLEGKILFKKDISSQRFRKMDAHSIPCDLVDNLDDDYFINIHETDTGIVFVISVVEFREKAKKMQFKGQEEKYYLPVRYFKKEVYSET